MRIRVTDAAWLDAGARERLAILQRNRINREGELVVASQAHRTQQANLADALRKLEKMVAAALRQPKQRKLRKGVSKATKERYVEHKRRRSDVKSSRRGWRSLDD